MAFRFRKSIKIMPGVRINLGKKGASLSVGGRGASITMGKHGNYTNISIPGTGISFREKINSKSSEQRRLKAEKKAYAKLMQEEHRREALKNISLELNDNGTITILDSNMEPLSRKDMKLLWEQHSDTIKDWLKNKMDEINGDVNLLENIYQDTVAPNNFIAYSPKPFNEKKPEKPIIKEKPELPPFKPLGFFSKFFKKRREEYEEQIKKQKEKYQKELLKWEEDKKNKLNIYEKKLKEWNDKKEKHDRQEKFYINNFDNLIQKDKNFMELMIDNTLNAISWPRETLISYQISDDMNKIIIDVDLPEIEDMPQKIASISSTGKKLNIKNKPKTKLRLEYAKHIHGIAFRIAGYVFATLPTIKKIVISGYSQRLNKATGKINDDYLYSYRITRDKFSEINFNSLEQVDPIEALDVFEHRKKMTSTGIFKPIEPFDE